jgi:hypothetical protein
MRHPARDGSCPDHTFAIDAQQGGFLPALRVPCAMSIRNFHDVAFIEDGPGLRLLTAEVPVIEIGTGPDGLLDWRAARIEGFSPSPILADFEIDPSGTHASFSVPLALATDAIVSVKVALPSMTIVTVTVSDREGGESVILLDNRP